MPELAQLEHEYRRVLEMHRLYVQLVKAHCQLAADILADPKINDKMARGMALRAITGDQSCESVPQEPQNARYQ